MITNAQLLQAIRDNDTGLVIKYIQENELTNSNIKTLIRNIPTTEDGDYVGTVFEVYNGRVIENAKYTVEYKDRFRCRILIDIKGE